MKVFQTKCDSVQALLNQNWIKKIENFKILWLWGVVIALRASRPFGLRWTPFSLSRIINKIFLQHFYTLNSFLYKFKRSFAIWLTQHSIFLVVDWERKIFSKQKKLCPLFYVKHHILGEDSWVKIFPERFYFEFDSLKFLFEKLCHLAQEKQHFRLRANFDCFNSSYAIWLTLCTVFLK